MEESVEEPSPSEGKLHRCTIGNRIQLTQLHFSRTEQDTSVDEKKATKAKPKAKKKPKKKADDDIDEYTKQLLEQEIPKTELEKFEKLEFEKSTRKSVSDKKDLIPIAIERKEQKPTKVKVVPVEEMQPVRLKAKKPRQIEPKAEEKATQPRLKSRITYVDVAQPQQMKLATIGAVRDRGELSRNVEEAEEALKFKPKKFKPKPKHEDSLERPELEKYEKYESSSDDESKGKPYQRGKKEKPEEDVETKKLKLGKLYCREENTFTFCLLYKIVWYS